MYLAFDLESGGVLPDTSLLTLYLSVLDANLVPIDSLYLKLKPNDDRYIITAGGMNVNKIDLIKHDAEAVTYSKGGQLLREFLLKHFNLLTFRLIPVGKNIYSDIAKINSQLLGEKVWGMYVSHVMLDLDSIIRFLQLQKKLPLNLPLSLTDLVDNFKIKHEGTPHEADVDTKNTVAVIRHLLTI